MRVAALYDIHGNLPALEAVLDEIRELGVDQIVVGGDVLPGPMPNQVLAYLLALDVPVQFIYGNGEVAVLEHRRGKELAAIPEQFRPAIRWNAEQITVAHEHLISGWPLTIRVEIGGLGDVLFCHATPKSENAIVTRETPEHRIRGLFESAGAPVVVCGHTHMQFDRMIGTARVVNAGSVGMPFGNPGADWLLLGPAIELRHVDYDLQQAAERIRSTNYPGAADFAANNILEPPREAKMLEVFSRAELR